MRGPGVRRYDKTRTRLVWHGSRAHVHLPAGCYWFSAHCDPRRMRCRIRTRASGGAGCRKPMWNWNAKRACCLPRNGRSWLISCLNRFAMKRSPRSKLPGLSRSSVGSPPMSAVKPSLFLRERSSRRHGLSQGREPSAEGFASFPHQPRAALARVLVDRRTGAVRPARRGMGANEVHYWLGLGEFRLARV